LEGRCQRVCVLCWTPEWCDGGVSTAAVAVEKAACFVCARISRYIREHLDGASSSVAGCLRTGASRRPSRIPDGGRWWRGVRGEYVKRAH